MGRILDLGCGRKKHPGAIGIDRRAYPGVDLVLDLEKDKLPFSTNSVDGVIADNILEHLVNLHSVVHEIHRVLKPGGWFYVVVPHFRSVAAVAEPEHVRFFAISTVKRLGSVEFGFPSFSLERLVVRPDGRLSLLRFAVGRLLHRHDAIGGVLNVFAVLRKNAPSSHKSI